jgi:vesicle transport protein SEC22
MVRLTLIARLSDGLPLAEGLDADKSPELEQAKAQAKAIFRRLAGCPPSSLGPPRVTAEAAPLCHHYLLDGGAVFLTSTDRAYPKRLAFQYLEELASEFSRLYGPQLETVTRPYAFVKFDTFISKTRRVFQDTRSQRNLSLLSKDLQEVSAIMTRNIAEVLGQGEQLDSMSKMSSALASESRAYATRAADLRRQALLRKYVPAATVVGVVVLVLLLRFWLY